MAGADESWFVRYASALAAAGTADAVRALFLDAARDAGFDALACGEIDLENRNRAAFLVNTWPQAWLDYYQREKVYEFDPLMARLRQSPGAFTWAEMTNRSRRELALFAEAERLGWADGLAISLPRRNAVLGLISLTAKAPVPDGEWREMTVLLFTLMYEKLRTLASGGVSHTLAGLSAREIDCLREVARGATDAATGRALGISASTAHEHIERAKRKLGCRTRAQLMAVAAALGVVGP